MWIAMDPYEGDTEEFETEKEAVEWASERIEHYLDGDGWSEGVDQIIVAEVKHRTEQTNIRNRTDVKIDEHGHDETGTAWSPEWSFMCEYKLMPTSEA